MIYVYLLFICGCWSYFPSIEVKGKIDGLIEDTNYARDDFIELDQLKVRKLVKCFLEDPKELEDPFEPSLFDDFSFIHLLFSMRCERNDVVFGEAYDKLFVEGSCPLERAFEERTATGLNLVHLTLKYRNQGGFAKIRSLNACLPRFAQYFAATDIIGIDPFMLASFSLSGGVVSSSHCNPSDLQFLARSIIYMSEKKYFLNSHNKVSLNKEGRNFLTGSIFAFVDNYENVNDIERFVPIFKFLIGNFLLNVGDKSKIEKILDNWEEMSGASEHELLKKKITEAKRKVVLFRRDKLEEVTKSITNIHFLEKLMNDHGNNILGKGPSSSKGSSRTKVKSGRGSSSPPFLRVISKKHVESPGRSSLAKFQSRVTSTPSSPEAAMRSDRRKITK